MASGHHLDYKVLYSPEENISNIRKIQEYEESQNYHFILGYTDLGAFLTPASINAIQENAKRFRKSIGDTVFSPCSIRNGLKDESVKHINLELKTYIDFDTDDPFEVIVQ